MTWTALYEARPASRKPQPAAEPQPKSDTWPSRWMKTNRPAGQEKGFDLSGEEFKLKEEPVPPGA